MFPNMKVGDPHHFRWLEGIVAAIFILNVMDGVLTLIWYFTEQATESNPLMEHLISASPLLFILVKIILVALGSVLLWRWRRRPLAVVAIFVAFIVYYGILVIHLSAMNLGVIVEFFD